MFIYKYGQTHHLATGIRANNETHPLSIASFITALEPKLSRMVARKFADTTNKPETLKDVFTMAERCSKRMQEADSYDRLLLSDFHQVSMKSTMPKVTGTIKDPVTMATGMVIKSLGVSKTITKAKRT